MNNKAKALGNQPINPINDEVSYHHKGMTYRQWLVGMAMQGLLATKCGHVVDFAYSAVVQADAVLEQLAQEKTNI